MLNLEEHIPFSFRHNGHHFDIHNRCVRNSIHQFCGFQQNVVREQIQRLSSPTAGIVSIGTKLNKLERVLQRIRVQINALLLINRGEDQVLPILQQNPLSRIPSIELESG